MHITHIKFRAGQRGCVVIRHPELLSLDQVVSLEFDVIQMHFKDKLMMERQEIRYSNQILGPTG